jgi:ferredoxin-NADP reductase
MSSLALTAVLCAMRHEANGVISLELGPAEGAPAFPSFTAGAHIDLHLPNGLVRSYSLLNPQGNSQRYIVAVLHDRNSRGGSRYVHEQLRVGTVLSISAPRNNFPLHEDAEHSVLVAGGIGITPMLCMLDRLVELNRQVDVIYCARSRREAAFIERIEVAAHAANVRVTWHFDDECGAPPKLEEMLAGRPAHTHFYCCGPGPMLDAFEKACDTLAYTNFHIERFSAAPFAGGSATVQEGYKVELQRSKKILDVPAGSSLLDVLLAAGLRHDFSCREGVCGACETTVLAGEVDHRDSILGKAERASNKTMMVCVSGCKKGPLVLDL